MAQFSGGGGRKLIGVYDLVSASEFVLEDLEEGFDYEFAVDFVGTSSVNLSWRVSGDNGATWIASGYTGLWSASSINNASAGNLAYLGSAGSRTRAFAALRAPMDPDFLTMMDGVYVRHSTLDAGPSVQIQQARAAHNAVRLFPTSGTVTGTVRVWRVKR